MKKTDIIEIIHRHAYQGGLTQAFEMLSLAGCEAVEKMNADEVDLAALSAELAECKQDAERYRWLTYDHDDAEQRKRCREIWDCGCVMSYSALSVYIDAAMAGGE